MVKNVWAFMLLFALSVSAPASAAALDGATAAAMGAAAQGIVTAGNAKSVSVCVVRDGQIVYAQTFGAGSNGNEYFIGSATKTFTAVSVMQLVAAHRLALTDRLSKFYPAFAHAQAITVEQLLTHTSGIPDFLPVGLQSGRAHNPITPDEIIADMGKLPLDFAPGTQWNYSNTGYALLGRIVEKVSGMPLAQYEAAHIFKPAGMNETAVAHAANPQNAAPGFEIAGSVLGTFGTTDPSWYYAVGDIVSTASDIARFDIALLGGKLVTPATLKRMMQPAPFRSTVAANWQDGLGFFLAKFGTEQLAGHHGGETGFRADNELLPARRLAIVILGNGTYETGTVLKAALAGLFPQAAAYQTAHPAPAPPDPAPNVTLQSAAFIRELMTGKTTPSTLTPAMNAGLTPAILDSFKTLAASYGSLRSLTFLTKGYSSGYTTYTYKAAFANGKVVYPLVVYDKDGKIAGVQHFQ